MYLGITVIVKAGESPALHNYDKAAAIAKEAYKTGKTVRQVGKEQNVLPQAELDKALDAVSMTNPG